MIGIISCESRSPNRISIECSDTIVLLKGETMEVKVEPGQKIMMATFKGDNLFYMTESMDSGYIPKVKTLKEKSSHGIIETTVKFIETK